MTRLKAGAPRILLRERTVAVGVLALVVLLAACGGETSDYGDAHAGDPTDRPTLTTPSAPASDDDSASSDADGGGDGSDDDSGDGGDRGGDDPGAEPTRGDDGWPADPCGTGEFGAGSWSMPGSRDTDTLTGVSAAGNAECARLLIHFDGPAPGVHIIRAPQNNDTQMSFLGDRPGGPVAPDLVTPDLELLTAAFVTSDRAGAGVRLLHGDHREVAVRVVPADSSIAVYVRTLQPEDTRHDPTAPRSWDVSLGGQPGRGLVVLGVRTEPSTGDVVVEGYAKAPESNVVLRVYDASGAEVCSDHSLAAGPPFLFSWFTRYCQPGDTGTYHLEVGWPDPAGTEPVWSEYEVTLR